MTATIIDGKVVADSIREELKVRIAGLKEKGVTPGLAVVLVGDDPASKSYVKAKGRACADMGIYAEDWHLPATSSQQELLDMIQRLNEDPKINGILIQLPLPRTINEQAVLVAIDPAKDVDGFHPLNIGRMISGEPAFLPCTPHGIIQLLLHSGVDTDGAHVVIVGRSNIVGRPLANLLLRKQRGGNATVTVCHSRTKDIGSLTRQADILIAAVGQPGLITADMVKDQAVVVDVGVNRVADPAYKRGYHLVGDVDFAGVSQKARLITPVPGGVGPLTITMLLYNVVFAAEGGPGRVP